MDGNNIMINEIEAKRVSPQDFSGIFQKRSDDSHKGNFGYVAILGGCKSYPGAIKLANLSVCALRSGCGVSRLIIPDCIYDSVSPMIVSSTLFTIPSENGYMIFNPNVIDESLKGISTLAIGMGWGQSEENLRILTYILQNYSINLVIDADGLNLISKYNKLQYLKNSNCRIIITPHLKEFERISGYKVDEIKQSPTHYAAEFALKYNVTVLLKGHQTITTDGKQTYSCDRGCVGMATAGSGDVLSGILAGILGYSNKNLPLISICAAYINGLAGEYAEKKSNPYSMISLDTAFSVSEAISSILNQL